MKKYMGFIKKRWPLIVLIAILLLGFDLRIYHINYPAIGYHNMKENEYLGEAKIMQDTGNLLHTKVLWKGLSKNDYMQEAIPFLPWLTALLWSAFGTELFLPRLIIIFSSLGSIYLIYLVGKKLTGKEYFSLTSALLMAIMPLGVFFGRNIQPEMPALFFLLMYMYFFLKWLDTRNNKDFIYFAICLAIAALLKITNLVGIVAFIFLIPYKDILKNYKKYWKLALILFVILLSIPIWIFISKTVTPTDYGIWSPHTNAMFKIYTKEYWQNNGEIIKNYAIGENFTAWYIWFSFFGLFFAALKYKSKFSRYIFGYVLAIVPYATILSTRIHQHNYYQMPFLPIVCFLSALFLFNLGNFAKQIVKNFTKHKQLLIAASIIPLLLIVPTIGSVETSINRQFDMQYIGYDVAGEFIKKNSAPEDRIFLEGISGGQGASLFFYAERFGTWMPQNLSEFKRGETEKNFKWVVLYNEVWRQNIDEGVFGIARKQEIWNYIQKNYYVRQVGLLNPENKKPMRVFMVLEKGKSLNESIVSSNPTIAMTYEFTYGKIPLYTVEG